MAVADPAQRILLEMPTHPPSLPPRQDRRTRPARATAFRVPPTFARRLKARNAGPFASLPSWVNWNAATLLAAFVVCGLLLWVLSPILAPFLAGAILAYIFHPMVSSLERRGVSRAFGTLLAVVLLLLAVALLMLIVLPLLYKEMAQLAQQLPNVGEQLKTRALPWLNERLGTQISLDPQAFRQFVTDNLSDASGIAQKIFASVGVGGKALLGFLVNLFLVPVVLFYLLRDWPQFIAQVDGMIPRRAHPTVTGIAREVDAVLSEFLRGQLSVMLIMAVFYVTGLMLVGLEFALPVGLITGLLVFVPYVGAGSGMLLGTIAAIIQFPSITGVALVWVVFAVGQMIEGFVVTPWLVGDRIGLHPVLVIFALLAFGQLFGFFGVLLALPASAAILVGLRHLQHRYRGSTLYLG